MATKTHQVPSIAALCMLVGNDWFISFCVDEFTMGSDDEHVFRNEEPTRALRPIRQKLLKLNDELLSLGPEVSRLSFAVEVNRVISLCAC